MHLYIVDTSKPFTGSILNSMPFVEEGIQDTTVHYSDKTFREYNKEHGGQLKAMTWEAFEQEYYAPYLSSLCQPFQECTEEHWWNMLECLPPVRWTRIEGGEYFFISEAYTANIHACLVKYNGKYYEAQRALTTTTEDIVNEIKSM